MNHSQKIQELVENAGQLLNNQVGKLDESVMQSILDFLAEINDLQSVIADQEKALVISEDEKKHTQEKLNFLESFVPLPIFIFNENGQIVRMNDKANKLLSSLPSDNDDDNSNIFINGLDEPSAALFLDHINNALSTEGEHKCQLTLTGMSGKSANLQLKSSKYYHLQDKKTLVISIIEHTNLYEKPPTEASKQAEPIENPNHSDYEKKISTRRAWAKAFFDQVTEAIFIHDLEGNLVEVNQQACESLGYKKEELLRLKVWDLDPDYIARKDTGKFWTKLPVEFEGRHKRQDGSIFPVRIKLDKMAIDDHNLIAAVAEDITTEKQADQQYKLNEERLRALVELGQMGTSKLEALYDYTLEKAVWLSGSAFGSIFTIKNSQPEVLTCTDKKNCIDCYRKFKQSGFNIFDEILETKQPIRKNSSLSKNEIPCKNKPLKNCLSIPVLEKGKVKLIFTVGNKKDPYNHADEHQLNLLAQGMWKIVKQKQLTQELYDAKIKAEESDRLKSAFLANMSHEIRTPLNGIIGFADLLGNPDLSNEKRIKFIHVLRKSSSQLIRIISDILELSKIESNEIRIVRKPHKLNYILKDIYEQSLKEEEINKHVQLYYHVGLPDDASVILIDRQILKDIFRKLINNAVKFTTSGKIEFGYDIIPPKDENVDGELRFFIRDTGIGIDKEMQSLIFEQFRQEDEGDRRSYGGLGIGLTICREYVKRLKGKIWVKSEKGKGACFYFTVPWVIPMEPEAYPEDVTTPEERNYYWKDKNVLIVEDNYSNFEFLHQVLVETEANVLHAPQASEALSIVNNKKPIDLILMDIQLPDQDGLELTRQIKLDNPDIKVIAQTAFAESKDKERAMEAGCDDYIAKPIDYNHLLEMIDRFFA